MPRLSNPLTSASNGCTGVARFIEVLSQFGLSIERIPSVADLRELGFSRATAYRWHNAITKGAVHASRRTQKKRLNELMPNWPRPCK